MIAFPIAAKMVVLVLTSVQAIDAYAHKDIPEPIANIHLGILQCMLVTVEIFPTKMGGGTTAIHT